jgi:hypothetical protein
VVWQNVADGRVSVWLLNGTALIGGYVIGQVTDLQWRIRAVADIDGDGRVDLFWHHQGNGTLAVWRLNGAAVLDARLFNAPAVVDPNWLLVGVADFDDNGSVDLLWHHQGDGSIGVWLMSGTSMTGGMSTTPGRVADLNWRIRGVGDINRDGHADLLWQHVSDGRIAAWVMNGLTLVSGATLVPSQVVDTNWRIAGPR